MATSTLRPLLLFSYLLMGGCAVYCNEGDNVTLKKMARAKRKTGCQAKIPTQGRSADVVPQTQLQRKGSRSRRMDYRPT